MFDAWRSWKLKMLYIYIYTHKCWWKTRAGPRNASNTPRFPKQSSGPSLSCRACCFPVDCLIRGWHSCILGQLMGGVNSTELNPSCAPKRLKQHPNSHLFSTSHSSDMYVLHVCCDWTVHSYFVLMFFLVYTSFLYHSKCKRLYS